ncbi:unnamed protein product [Echinostoma caproni]|uniref:Uncharacterized protein n=1 Tax=Echinostoma caproni TaxID=27848 RepID=A0A183BFG7_9TREM|nr:unnamed protein product [Echinostoma caproni]
MPDSREPLAQARLNADVSLLRGVLAILFIPGAETAPGETNEGRFQARSQTRGRCLSSTESRPRIDGGNQVCIPARLPPERGARQATTRPRRGRTAEAEAEIHERRASGEQALFIRDFSGPEEAPIFPVEPYCNTEQSLLRRKLEGRVVGYYRQAQPRVHSVCQYTYCFEQTGRVGCVCHRVFPGGHRPHRNLAHPRHS